MNRWPDPTQPTAPQAGQPVQNIDAVADALMASVNKAIADEQAKPYVTSFRDETRAPTIGTTPAVPQPGRTPMSQKATDATGIILAVGIASPLVGGAFALAMWGTSVANLKVIGAIVGGAIGLAIAIKSLLGSARDVAEAAPPTIHQHFDGAVVYQDNSTHNQESKGLMIRNTNDYSTNL